MFYISIWGLEALFGGLSPPKRPCGDGVVTNFKIPNYAQQMFAPLFVNSTIARLTCFPASQMTIRTLLMFSVSLVAASEKEVLGGKQTRRRLFALCQVVIYCKYVTPNRHVIALSMKKKMMSLLKRSHNSRANCAMSRR